MLQAGSRSQELRRLEKQGLAAGYVDRPLQLIGPRYFLTWWRLLKLLLAIVPAVAFVGVSVIFAVLGIGVILWDQLRGFVRVDGEALAILHPQLWPWCS